MSVWQGANVKSATTTGLTASGSVIAPSTNATTTSQLGGSHSGDSAGASATTANPTTAAAAAAPPTETVEATLNRLSKAYSAAMQAFGHWHQLGDDIDQVKQVGRTTRETFETAILLDPLVISHAPELSRQWQKWAKKSTPKTRWQWVRQTRPPPPTLTSKAHRATVQQLSYLSLVNYGDLLMSGCRCCSVEYPNGAVLDRGVVQSHAGFNIANVSRCCWKTWDGRMEDEAETVQAAIWAYLDATALDGTDPALWLKLASAGRRRGWLNSPTAPALLLSHRHLESYALQRARAALPPHVPPNRLVAKIMREWQAENEVAEFPPTTWVEPPAPVLTLSLPRYSWLTLLRLLLKVCREGVMYGRGDDDLDDDTPRMMPLIQLTISPLLTLPTKVVASVNQFLDPASERRLESTCRALSKSVLSARALSKYVQAVRRDSLAAAAATTAPEQQQQQQYHQQAPESETGTDPPDDGAASAVTGNSAAAAATSSDGGRGTPQRAPASRMSKRVRSQKMSSNIRAERLARRESLEHNFFAAVGGVIADGPEIKEARARRQAAVQAYQTRCMKDDLGATAAAEDDAVARDVTASSNDAQEVTCEHSLYSFLARYQDRPTSLMNILFDVILHIARIPAYVYSSEPTSSALLTNAVLEAFHRLIIDRQNQQALVPCWCERTISTSPHASLSTMDAVSLDLLYAELRFQRCFGDQELSGDPDSDPGVVMLLTPRLTRTAAAESETKASATTEVATSTRVRCLWLAATFAVWRTRFVSPEYSQRLEQEAIEHVVDAMGELPSNTEVAVPHLSSASRRGEHWKKLSAETLLAFRNDLQASSIVVAAQESFLSIRAKLLEGEDEPELSVESLATLILVGNSLMERYHGPMDTDESKHGELLDGFLAAYSEWLVNTTYDPVQVFIWLEGKPLDVAIRVKELAQPCVLDILGLCVGQNVDFADKMATLLTQLAVAVCRRQMIRQNRNGATRLRDARALAFLIDAFIAIQPQCHDARRDGFQEDVVFLITAAAKWFEGHPIDSSGQAIITSLHNVYAMSARTGKTGKDAVTDPFARFLVQAFLRGTAALRASSKVEAQESRVKHVEPCVDLIVACCSHVGEVFSRNTVKSAGSGILNRFLMKDSAGDKLLVLDLSYDLLWLWRVVLGVKTGLHETYDVFGDERRHVLPIRDPRGRLAVPTAIGILSTCGAMLGSQTQTTMNTLRCSLSDLYDSDTSVADWLTDVDNEVFGEIQTSDRHDYLSALAHAAFAVDYVFQQVSDVEINDWLPTKSSRHERSFLARVAERVINPFIDYLLSNFGRTSDDDEDRELPTQYPFGTRSTGVRLDSCLAKAYRCLYGIDLSTEEARQSSKFSAPEDEHAVIGLYQYMMRVSSSGRKALPKRILDTVTCALPPKKLSETARKLRRYLFSAETEMVNADLSTLQPGIDVLAALSDRHRFPDVIGELDLVRRGIDALVADGPLPVYQDSSAADQSVRRASAQFGQELSRKFSAVLQQQCEGSDIMNFDGWYKAAQCAFDKADAIADRVGFQLGYMRQDDFPVNKGQRPELMQSTALADLCVKQQKEYETQSSTWVPFLGKDLSIYVDYEWSSLESLKACSMAAKDSLYGNEPINDLYKRVQAAVEHLRSSGNVAAWQEAWAGMFIASLRIIGLRCTAVAIGLIDRTASDSNARKHAAIESELKETAGTVLYTSLVGRQRYGFPMQCLTLFEIRGIAEAALSMFVASNESSKTIRGDTEDTGEWDVLFMIGKCHEKIALTFRAESFFSSTNGSNSSTLTRRYEVHMAIALDTYAKSLELARGMERETGQVSDQNGGSTHGSSEALYRLHATRLKILLQAVSLNEAVRDCAIDEALQLAEMHWFANAHVANDVGVQNRNDRVWTVVADIVAALVQCRRDHSFFHRSVYRHAQALMWAPVLADPDRGRGEGSLGTVPATKAVNIPGLNQATNAAESAAAVIGVLFDRKRPQLCAAWVSASGPRTPFQLVNQHVRKYDSLRGKYIHAYITALQLCNQRVDLETFLRWTAVTTRDLPSYFAATAQANVVKPPSHMTDCLLMNTRSMSSFHFLTEVKRKANAAFAAVLRAEISTATTAADPKKAENNLKATYACFLRLNAEVNTVVQKKHQRGGVEDILEALAAAYMHFDGNAIQPTDWGASRQNAEIVQAAVTKCKSLFPTLSGSFYSKKKTPTKKRRSADDTDGVDDGADEDDNGPIVPPTPPTAPSPATAAHATSTSPPATIKRKFEVAVPAGLEEGASFVVSIVNGTRRIKLTVPAGQPSMLRFTLDVESSPPPPAPAAIPTTAPSDASNNESSSSSSPRPSKKQKTGEDE